MRTSDLERLEAEAREPIRRIQRRRRRHRDITPRPRGTRPLRPNSRYSPTQYDLGGFRNRRAFLADVIKHIVEDNELLSKIKDVDDPDTYQYRDAKDHPFESSQWTASILDKLRSIRKAKVWELVDLGENSKHPVIGCRWVFKKKLAPNGSVSRYKSRLVARGFTQKKGINFNETFAPVAKFTSLRLIFAMASELGWDIHQLDAKTAFLCSEIDQDDVYIKIPDGYHLLNDASTKTMKNPVLRLKKALYGLRQAPRLWYRKLTDALKEFGFVRSELDHSVWLKKSCIVSIYVDDILVAGANQDIIDQIKKDLSSRFEMVDSGLVNFFLGLTVKRDKHGYGLTQEHYIDRILAEFGMTDCSPQSTPLAGLLRPRNPDSDDPVDKPTDLKRYQRAIGRLMYLMLGTRPDIAFAVSHLSRFCADPTNLHWQAVKRLLRYLKGTKDNILWFNGTAAKPKTSEDIYGFSDADWASDSYDRKSVGSYLFYYRGSVVSWASKKQTFVATSTMESEYVSAATACKEGIW